MNLKLTFVAVLALGLGALLALGLTGGFTIDLVGHAGHSTASSSSSPTIVIGKALIGGPFHLVDQTGRTVTDEDFRGRFMLVYFGYTFCPDVCPASLQVISAALDQLGAEADKITPVFITMDPARDTPDKLAAYLQSFHPRFVGLTGTQSDVAAALKAYRVYAKRVPDDKNPADYTFDHSSIAFLMNPSGNLVAFAPETTKVDAVAMQLRKGLAAKE